MKTGKAIAALLGLTAAAALFSGCGEKQTLPDITLIVKTPPLNVSDGTDINLPAVDFFKKVGEEFSAQYKDANVTVKPIQFAYTDEVEYVTGCFGTEDAADILMGGYFNISSYIYDGNVAPLDDILSDELIADFNPTEFALGQVQGKTYMLPFYSLQNTLNYNKDLFRQCGLDEYIGEGLSVQHWSLDDWEIILDTLAEKLPEMTYPMMMYAKNNQGDTHIMTLLRSHGSSFFDENGYFHLNTPEGIAALQWIKDGYDKGYFPDNCENLEIVDSMTLYQNGQLAICMTNNASSEDLSPERDGLVNFPSTDGKGLSTSFVTGFLVFDNENEAKLTAAKEFLRFLYSREEYLDYERLALPANQSVSARSKDIIFNLDAYLANSDTYVDFTANNPNWQGSDDSVRSIFWTHIHDLLTGDVTPEECAAILDETCNEAIQKGHDSGKLHE